MRAPRDDDDLAGAAGPRRDHRREPDRPRAEYRDALADLEPGEPHAVHGHAEGLAERRGREVDACWHAEAVPGRSADVLRESAGDRQADEADGGTALVVARQTVAARAARRDALERDRVSRLERCHPVAHVRHLARDLVAGTDRRDHHLVMVPVEIRAADATVAHADHDLAGSGRRARDIFDDEPAYPAAEGGAHGGHARLLQRRRDPRNDGPPRGITRATVGVDEITIQLREELTRACPRADGPPVARFDRSRRRGRAGISGPEALRQALRDRDHGLYRALSEGRRGLQAECML